MESTFDGPGTQQTFVTLSTGLTYRPSFDGFALLINPIGDGVNYAVSMPDLQLSTNLISRQRQRRRKMP